MSLYPTKTRLRRLRAVAGGEVHRYGDGHDYTTAGIKVDAVMAQMHAAGWVVLGAEHPVRTPWHLTRVGWEVVDG